MIRRAYEGEIILRNKKPNLNPHSCCDVRCAAGIRRLLEEKKIIHLPPFFLLSDDIITVIV